LHWRWHHVESRAKTKIEKKWKLEILWTKQACFFGTMPFNPWAVLATWLHVGTPKKNIGRMNLQPVLNKNSPGAHMELKFDMFGVAKKLVKYVVHLSKRKKYFLRKILWQTTNFWFQRIVGVNC
jgi:hypothetical protein